MIRYGRGGCLIIRISRMIEECKSGVAEGLSVEGIARHGGQVVRHQRRQRRGQVAGGW